MGNGTFDGIRKPLNAFLAVIIHHAFPVQPLGCAELNGIIRFVGVQSQQVFLHTAYTMVYRHVIVVEDNQQIVRT